MPIDPQTRARGIDISKWQRDIDWPQVKASGLSFVYVKATEGALITDPCFTKHWAGAKAAGLLRGAYLFYRCDQDPVQQAALFAKTLGADSGEMPPALDVEDAKSKVEAATRIQGVAACLNEIERLLGRHPIIYTAPYYWQNNLCDAAGQYPAWSAHYALWEANYTTGKSPWLPPGWSEWKIWQYTDKGQVPGIAGNVDSDWFNGTPDDLLKWLGRSATVAHTTPAEQPIPSGKAVTNQMMINAFSKAFGSTFWDDVVVRAGLTSIGLPPENRPKPYTGPAVDQIPNLTDDEKAKLKAALGR
jgi:lysozyme